MLDYTSDGVAVLSDETLKSYVEVIKREMLDPSWERTLEERLRAENPIYLKIIALVSQREKNQDYLDGFTTGIVMSYELNRKQCAANKLEETL